MYVSTFGSTMSMARMLSRYPVAHDRTPAVGGLRDGVASPSQAGLAASIRWRVGDAVTHLNDAEGKFDVVYNDIDKDGYPDAWRAARERIRVGGLYLCDNVLWYGRVTEPEPERADTRAILEHNALVAEDERYLSAIVPTRDGLMVAIRVR